MSCRETTGLLELSPFTATDAGRAAWAAVAAYVGPRPFLRSEGMGARLAAPRRAAPWLAEASRELVRRFDHFYRLVLDAPALKDEPALALGQPYDAIVAAEGARLPLPLSRFDCVLDAQGVLRVIELNPVGVCTLHLRAAAYLAHVLERSADDEHHAAAQAIDAFSVAKTASMERFIAATSTSTRRRVGILIMPGMHRGSLVFWRAELARAGFEVLVGRPESVRVSGGQALLDDQPVDALWIDWVAYLGFQQRRYEQTRFTTKAGDFSSASHLTQQLLTLPGLAALVADHRLTLFSPVRSLRAISKALLAFIDHPALPLSADERAYLHAHVTDTFDHHARANGKLTVDRAHAEREDLVLKPCRFGGSHGVVVGRELGADEWARRLDETWSDPEWVLQRFSAPVTDDDGAYLSYGVYNYGGELGGILVRRAPQLVVSARTADLIVAVS